MNAEAENQRRQRTDKSRSERPDVDEVRVAEPEFFAQIKRKAHPAGEIIFGGGRHSVRSSKYQASNIRRGLSLDA